MKKVLLLCKSQVKAHTRTLKSGKVVQVRAHDNGRRAKSPSDSVSEKPSVKPENHVRAEDQGWDTSLVLHHHSKSQFDRFDLAKVGNGSGAQTEGWGIYFADRKDNAKKFGKNGYQVFVPHYLHDRMIDYGKKFSDQPDYVRRALGKEYGFLGDKELTGWEIYKRITRESRNSQRGASQFLSRLGIMGAKMAAYYDLRSNDPSGKNFVIWDQDALNDLRSTDAEFHPDQIDATTLHKAIILVVRKQGSK